MQMESSFWKDRLKATAIHLGISLTLAGLAALLVFFVWYPAPYWEISGGRNLFLLVVSVDVIMGPLMTLVVFNRNKPNRELYRDLSVIGLLQLVALAYGLWTVAVARPVHLVFEIDRFRVVHAVDIPAELLGKAPAELRQLPLMGPTLLSVRAFKDSKESFDATMAAVQGLPLSARPDLWQRYEDAKSEILKSARSLAELKTRFPARSAEIDRAIQASLTPSTVTAVTDVGYVPMVGRNTFWTVLIDINTAGIIAFVPVDSF
ncbi:TfpX/TfpZ family type IV pilin accessory protein [Rhodoferax sp. U11-2br]|uniref:TfpX/TfpZ family type IV pilin accessory protein n=1 Tax=Rhodoferax sp. U11-2br TaxID=2838878 RepID=UPI001BE553F0|nr:TfpX/TfpZ family type IV pilin accessory protein [Rhodoferax sp. U11-2br]MBT3065445.1 pilus assembly protein [Rhodoferax sp. U11-2br]